MIGSIRLQNFRSYRDSSFEFDPGVNIIVGPNASGKTNLLEAILVLCRGSSYRAKDAELVSFGRSWARLDGYFEQQRSLKLEIKDQLPTKTFLIDDKSFKRLSLERTEPAVLFEPNHLQLLIRGPERRRDYFDELLSRSQPGYKSLLNSYRRALAQRNALLKNGQAAGHNQLFVWDVRLSQLAEKIAIARKELVDDINKSLPKTYSAIAGSKTKLELNYQNQFAVESYGSGLLAKLGANAKRDFERGYTAYGPHREDFIFFLAAKDASTSASRGETRSIMLSVKIYELKLIEKVRGTRPLFLLDDVFSELDGARRRSLVNFLKDYQAIITTTDAEAVLEYFASGTQNLISLTK
ncbi:MAG TPA: DNA replication and repair protein RecF [Candidatus Binatia bacterium]|nr:DNA replication and repair protein RecF [Candidatus Binatia bacterium]